MIDWQEITDGYNERMGTKYSVKEFLTMAYAKHGTLTRTGEWIGASEKTLSKAMHRYGCELPRNSGSRPGVRHLLLRERLDKIPDDKLRNMTRKQIAQSIGCPNLADVSNLLSQYPRPYKKKPRTRPEHGKKEAIFLSLADKSMTVKDLAREAGMSKSYV